MSLLPTDIWQVIVGFCPIKLKFRKVCKQLRDLEYEILYMYFPNRHSITEFPTNLRVATLYPNRFTKDLQQTGINFEYVISLDCGINNCLEDKDLLLLPNLINLYCVCNKNFTNAGIIGLNNLISFECGCNTNFTDECLINLPNLTSLDCYKNINLTENGVASLKKLKILICGNNTNFTDTLLIELPNLTKLDCGFNKKFTNQGLHNLPLLEKVISSENGHITKDYVKRYFPLVKCEIFPEFKFI